MESEGGWSFIFAVVVVFGAYYLLQSGMSGADSSEGGGDKGEDNVQPSPPQFSGNVITNDPASWPSGDLAWTVAQAIAFAEGYNLPSAVPYRLNNPGDLSDGGHLYGSEPHSGSSVTTFPTAAVGWQWLHDKIVNIATGQSSVYSPDMTWEQLAQKWAGNWSNWVAIVTQRLNVSPSDRVGDYFGVPASGAGGSF